MLKADIEFTRRLLLDCSTLKRLRHCSIITILRSKLMPKRFDQISGLCRISDSGVNMKFRTPHQCKSLF
jgi:hypothetical protein